MSAQGFGRGGRGGGGFNPNRRCNFCDELLHPGHSKTCTGVRPPQYGQVAQNDNKMNEVLKKLEQALNRISFLENQPTSPTSWDVLATLHDRAPEGAQNRVFSLSLDMLTGSETTTWEAYKRLTINSEMPGFAKWSENYVQVAVSRVVVTYKPFIYNGFSGTAGLMIGMARANEGDLDGAGVTALERKEYSGALDQIHFWTEYPKSVPFERMLLGASGNRIMRPFARLHIMRTVRHTTAVDPNKVLPFGLLHVYVQCACVRSN